MSVVEDSDFSEVVCGRLFGFFEVFFGSRVCWSKCYATVGARCSEYKPCAVEDNCSETVPVAPGPT